MTQATGTGTFFEALVEYKVAGGAWTDMSGWGAAISRDGGERQTGEAYTFDGDTAIGGIGKRQPIDVKVKALYTEQDTDPYKVFQTNYESHTVVQLRWSPLGGDLNEYRFTTDSTYSYIVDCPQPAGEAGSGDPITFEATIRTTKITQDKETT